MCKETDKLLWQAWLGLETLLEQVMALASSESMEASRLPSLASIGTSSYNLEWFSTGQTQWRTQPVSWVNRNYLVSLHFQRKESIYLASDRFQSRYQAVTQALALSECHKTYRVDVQSADTWAVIGWMLKKSQMWTMPESIAGKVISLQDEHGVWLVQPPWSSASLCAMSLQALMQYHSCKFASCLPYSSPLQTSILVLITPNLLAGILLHRIMVKIHQWPWDFQWEVDLLDASMIKWGQHRQIEFVRFFTYLITKRSIRPNPTYNTERITSNKRCLFYSSRIWTNVTDTWGKVDVYHLGMRCCFLGTCRMLSSWSYYWAQFAVFRRGIFGSAILDLTLTFFSRMTFGCSFSSASCIAGRCCSCGLLCWSTQAGCIIAYCGSTFCATR